MNFYENCNTEKESSGLLTLAYSYVFPRKQIALLQNISETSVSLLVSLLFYNRSNGNKLLEHFKKLKNTTTSTDNMNMSGPPSPILHSHLGASFRHIFDAICSSIKKPGVVPLVYLLVNDNSNFKFYTVSRVDCETLVRYLYNLDTVESYPTTLV
jgi:hypothetical protein